MGNTRTRNERRRFGEEHHRARFTDHEVELIRGLYEEGMLQREIADKFDTRQSTISAIVRFTRRNVSLHNN